MGKRFNPKTFVLVLTIVLLSFVLINDRTMNLPPESSGSAFVVSSRFSDVDDSPVSIATPSPLKKTATSSKAMTMAPKPTTNNERTAIMGGSATTLKITTPNSPIDSVVTFPVGKLGTLVPVNKRENKCEDCSRACPTCEKERTAFYRRYTNYCSQKYLPRMQNKKPLCSCWPDTLVGYEKPDFSMPTMGELRSKLKVSMFQGNWSPSKCTARQRVAIIIPCRDREEHLRIFLNRINTVLQRQQISYQIFVIEQVSPELFNKAAMMNIAYIQARKQEKFDCYFFHDVDMIPENDHNIYTCLHEMPRHVGSYLDKFGYRVIFPKNFGGVTAFTEKQFVKVNGFSNMFFGWGGEDDDMYYRIHKSGMWIDRYPSTIGRYSMVKHRHDERNPLNRNRISIMYAARKEVSYKNDGLNSLKYNLIAMVDKPLFKLIYASVPLPVITPAPTVKPKSTAKPKV